MAGAPLSLILQGVSPDVRPPGVAVRRDRPLEKQEGVILGSDVKSEEYVKWTGPDRLPTLLALFGFSIPEAVLQGLPVFSLFYEKQSYVCFQQGNGTLFAAPAPRARPIQNGQYNT
jgi:hypothetical protein